MVLVGFNASNKEALLNGAKQQTIRKPRKRRWKRNDILNLYWKIRTKQCEKLFDVPLESVERIQLEDITEEIAIADGFHSKEECVNWFNKTHKKYINSGFYEGFDLIKWDFTKRKVPDCCRIILTQDGIKKIRIVKQEGG